MRKHTTLLGLAGSVGTILVLSLNPSSYAAVVTWEPAHNISQSTDVVTTGELVGAFNVGASGVTSTTVNTVVFSPLEVPNDFSTGSTVIGNFTFSGGARISNNTSHGSSSPPFSTLAASSPSYATLLQSAGGGMNSSSLSISGLLIDRVYIFQIWTNESGFGGSILPLTVGSGATQVTLDVNTSDSPGGTGQFAIGTFVANSSFQEFEFLGTGFPINAFQLRMSGIVPEPSTWGILGLGIPILVNKRRRRLR